MTERRRLIICGAAGRDYHNFNRVYRDDATVEVVAFTATQIPGIEDRSYPPELAGSNYPHGIPIVDEDTLEQQISAHSVDEVVFAYSDVSHSQVMHVASRVLAGGASFAILGPVATMIKAECPVIAISAVRTGCGKSQVARYLSKELRARGYRVAAIRHPMPYGALGSQKMQRFASPADIDAAQCTLEEREEYEPHVAAGNVVFAGVDYSAITSAAVAEADLIVWDGGNNDFPFLRPDLHIVVTDALRPDQLQTHHPGEAVLRMADLVIVNKVDAARADQTDALFAGLRSLVPNAPLVMAASPVTLDEPIAPGSRVLVVEDGPTITHGGMSFGSGFQAVKDLDLKIIDPRASAAPEIARIYAAHPHIGQVLPAVGYDPAQLEALRQTIDDSSADVVVAGTPIDFARDVPISKPVVRARYRYQDHSEPGLMELIDDFLKQLG